MHTVMKMYKSLNGVKGIDGKFNTKVMPHRSVGKITTMNDVISSNQPE